MIGWNGNEVQLIGCNWKGTVDMKETVISEVKIYLNQV